MFGIVKRISVKPFWKDGLTADLSLLVFYDAPLPKNMVPKEGSILQSLIRSGSFIYTSGRFSIGLRKKPQITKNTNLFEGP